jgi:hypothetical protein
MISVEATWQDHTGTMRSVTARMENKSDSGACIRIGIAVAVGSKLGIRCRWDQFSGTTKYCIGDEGTYLVGIQRDTTNGAAIAHLVSTMVPPRERVKSSDPPLSTAAPRNFQKAQESARSAIAPVEQKVENEPIVHAVKRVPTPPPRETREKLASKPAPEEVDDLRKIGLQTRETSKEEETGKKRKHMRRNWFGLTHKDAKQDVPDGNGAANGDNGNGSLEIPSSAGRTSASPAGEEAAGFPVELLAIEDIYRTSGIRAPRKDYGINKVIEMLRSEHVRDLPSEMKRAAVLMALDAAGIPVEEVLRDAKARQDALDAYEAERKTQIEAEWARKAKENAQILAELEGIKLHHMACVNRNLDRIVREKATFGEWLVTKLQETQSISEAAALCLKSSVAEPAADPPSRDSAAGEAAEAARVSSTAQSPGKTVRQEIHGPVK